jgi:hypothetical protein
MIFEENLMSWTKVRLNSEQIEDQLLLDKLRKQFVKLYMVADGPDEMALLSDHKFKDGEINFYFTPACKPSCDQLISQFNGKECDQPTIDQVFLLDGNDYALDLLTENFA